MRSRQCELRSATPRLRRSFAPAIFLSLLLCCAGSALQAQTIRVDAAPEHSTNSIIPNRALGAGIDRLPHGATDKLFVEPMVKEVLSAGWQPVSYRQNTELHMEAWHWNPAGMWSDPSGKGYFTGSAAPGAFIRHSYGYPLPHRGVTRDDGTDMVGYSRLTDGDKNSYWKSNPYLTQAFTGEDDSLHPQWIFLDLSSRQAVSYTHLDVYKRQAFQSEVHLFYALPVLPRR